VPHGDGERWPREPARHYSLPAGSDRDIVCDDLALRQSDSAGFLKERGPLRQLVAHITSSPAPLRFSRSPDSTACSAGSQPDLFAKSHGRAGQPVRRPQPL